MDPETNYVKTPSAWASFQDTPKKKQAQTSCRIGTCTKDSDVFSKEKQTMNKMSIDPQIIAYACLSKTRKFLIIFYVLHSKTVHKISTIKVSLPNTALQD